MGHQIIKQPNGKLALWSSVVDDFIMLNATEQHIIDYYLEKEKAKIQASVRATVALIEDGKPPYYQFTKTWAEACAFASVVHGADWKPGGKDGTVDIGSL